VFSTLFGVALSHIGPRLAVIDFLDSFVHGVFRLSG
jgi:aerobic C4-dicarboxylate transport protein